MAKTAVARARSLYARASDDYTRKTAPPAINAAPSDRNPSRSGCSRPRSAIAPLPIPNAAQASGIPQHDDASTARPAAAKPPPPTTPMRPSVTSIMRTFSWGAAYQ